MCKLLFVSTVEIKLRLSICVSVLITFDSELVQIFEEYFNLLYSPFNFTCLLSFFFFNSYA